MNEGELPPVWRLVFAFGIVFGLIFAGLIFVYSWFFAAPFVIGAAAAIVFARKLRT